MPFDKDTIDRYIEREGSYCPHCASGDLIGVSSVELEGRMGWQTIECNDCHKRWTDVFRLVAIEEVDEWK